MNDALIVAKDQNCKMGDVNARDNKVMLPEFVIAYFLVKDKPSFIKTLFCSNCKDNNGTLSCKKDSNDGIRA